MLKAFWFYLIALGGIVAIVKSNWRPDVNVLALLVIAVMVVALLFERQKRRSAEIGSEQSSRYTLIGTLFVIAMFSLGSAVGWMLPNIGVKFLPFGLLCSIGVFFLLAPTELLLVRKLRPSVTAAYYVNQYMFPFFAFGVAVQVSIRT